MGSSNCEVVSCNKKKEETRPVRQANFLMERVRQNVAFAELDCICYLLMLIGSIYHRCVTLTLLLWFNLFYFIHHGTTRLLLLRICAPLCGHSIYFSQSLGSTVNIYTFKPNRCREGVYYYSMKNAPLVFFLSFSFFIFF